MSLKLNQSEHLNFAIEVDHKPRRGGHLMMSGEIRDKPLYKNDMQFEIRLPDGTIERRYITRKRLNEIGIIQFRVMREKLYE